jgi:hypothetical protein
LEASEINLAIAAVVEAIDDLQSQNHQQLASGTHFTGGFCLTTSNDLALREGRPVSRPRRPFLMPLSILEGGHLERINQWRRDNGQQVPASSGRANGHHLLAAVQESTENQRFEISFYDSGPHVFRNARLPLARLVIRLYRGLGWYTQRAKPRENPLYRVVLAARQQPGGWQCGPHTIINAWILAMGMHPDPRKVYDNRTYEEFHLLARPAVVGVLDWQALVSWLLCRRFRHTRFWRNEAALTERIEEVKQDDNMLDIFEEDELPYDLGNNPVHFMDELLEAAQTVADNGREAKTKKKTVAPKVQEEEDENDSDEEEEEEANGEDEDEEEEDDDSDIDIIDSDNEEDDNETGGNAGLDVNLLEDKSDQPSALGRSYDEPLDQRRVRKDRLRFLNNYNVDDDGDVRMTDVVSRKEGKKVE